MAAPTLEAIARELYAIRPDRFVAARDERARALAADAASKPLAAEVRRLRRPAPAAWAVNLLAQRAGADLDELLALGEELRWAQDELDAAALSRLAAERRAALGGLGARATELAGAEGAPLRGAVRDEAVQTLQAATTDAGAAAAVRSGRLVRPLETVGVEVDLDGALAGGPADADGGTPRRGGRGAGRAGGAAGRSGRAAGGAAGRGGREAASVRGKESERASVAAEQRRAARAAAARLADAERVLRRAERELAHRFEARDELREERERLEQRLGELGGELADAERAATAAEQARDRAAAEADAAKR